MVSVEGMNEEWMDWSIELSAAILRGHYFSAWERAQKLYNELDEFTTQMLETKSQVKDL